MCFDNVELKTDMVIYWYALYCIDMYRQDVIGLALDRCLLDADDQNHNVYLLGRVCMQDIYFVHCQLRKLQIWHENTN